MTAAERRARQLWGCNVHRERVTACKLARKYGVRYMLGALREFLRASPTRLDAFLAAEAFEAIAGRPPIMPKRFSSGPPRSLGQNAAPAAIVALLRAAVADKKAGRPLPWDREVARAA